MNYRHAYHAGNFADVVKHLVLTLVITHLRSKPAPFRVIDTHAGIGLYDLTSEAATKTGEWRDGIGRLLSAELSPAAEHVLAPYLALVRNLDPEPAHDGPLRHYPGSPLIARRLLRDGDHLIANELHPEDREHLEAVFARDAAVKVMGLDAWVALRALLPPKERRGVIIVDPPFELAGDLDRLVTGLRDSVARFATGTYLLWFPIKDLKPIFRFYRALSALGLPKLAAIEILIRGTQDVTRLNGCGLIVLNPPFTLADNLALVMPELTRILAQSPDASWRWIDLSIAS